MGYGDQGFLGPREEPVDRALREQGWKLLRSLAQLLTNRGEGKDNMEAVLNSSDKVCPQLY